MVAKVCSMSHGQPSSRSRRRAMMASRRSIGVRSAGGAGRGIRRIRPRAEPARKPERLAKSPPGREARPMSPAWPRWVRNAAIVLAVGWALAALVPFGTYTDFSPAERHGYWIGLTLAMWLQIEAAWLALGRLWPQLRAPLAIRAAIAAAVGAVPTTFEVAYLEGLLRVGGVLTPRSMLETYASVLIIAVGLFVPLRLLDRPARDTGSAPEPSAGDLPPGLAGDVIALTAEDHYL